MEVSRVSELLTESSQGDPDSTAALVELLYSELMSQARRLICPEGGAVDTASLVNDAYLRLVDQRITSWEDKAHFLGIAARTLRRVLVDRLRATGRRQRLVGRLVPGGEAMIPDRRGERELDTVDVLDLDAALRELGELDSHSEILAELQLFGGLSGREISRVLGKGHSKVAEDLKFASSWLGDRLGGGAES